MKLRKASSLAGFMWASYMLAAAYTTHNPTFAVVSAVTLNMISLGLIARLRSRAEGRRMRKQAPSRTQKLLMPGDPKREVRIY